MRPLVIGEDDLPLIHFVRHTNVNLHVQGLDFGFRKDNVINPYLTDNLSDDITTETIRYTVQYGKEFYITSAEIKRSYGINIIMTY